MSKLKKSRLNRRVRVRGRGHMSKMEGEDPTNEGYQCLICLKKTDCSQTVSKLNVEERQLSAIYLVNKLLGIPSEVCANYLENFGNPEEWISICPDCSSFVDQGRRLFNQIQELEQAHKRIGRELKKRMQVKSEQVGLERATTEIRNCLGLWDPVDNVHGENLLEVEDGERESMHFSNKYQNPKEMETDWQHFEPEIDITETFLKIEVEEEFEPEETAKIDENEMKLGQTEENDTLQIKMTNFPEDCLNPKQLRDIPQAFSNNQNQAFSTTITEDCNNEAIKIKKKLLRGRLHDLTVNDACDPDEGICEECGAQYTNFRSLETHMREQHFEPEFLICLGCLTHFQHMISYTTHYIDMNELDPYSSCATSAFTCELGDCNGIVRSSQQALDLHKKIFHANRVFKCPEPGCHAKFSYKRILRSHLTRKHQH